MPDEYRRYYHSLIHYTTTVHERAADARSTQFDVSDVVEPKIAFDLPDRVAKMHNVNITRTLREMLNRMDKEIAAKEIANLIVKGEFLPPDTPLEERLDLAVRVGLAIVTEGVTIAPLQGISSVDIKENRDGTKYLSVSIAGPMRSAGGTESAATMLIADHVRVTAGLDRYQADSFGDDEAGRFVEELRLYERDVGNFQYNVTDEDIVHVISNLPVELAGVDTDPYEVVNHRNMRRIRTDRVRGGALRVLNDGLIGRAKKLRKRVEMYKLQGWDWLRDLKGATKMQDSEDDSTKRMRGVITGRSVLSTAGKIGGFRLRYGRSCNTGFANVGVHPAIAELLEYTIVVGTQIKTDIPGKGATIAFVDSIEPPTVMLKNGNVVKIVDAQHAFSLRNSIQRILHLGDILISFGDFLENNSTLIPTGYVEEFWDREAAEHQIHLDHTPTLSEALQLSTKLSIPLHPKYLYFWDLISSSELQLLLKPNNSNADSISYGLQAKKVLEKLGVPHVMQNDLAVLTGDEARLFYAVVFSGKPALDVPPILALSQASGITLRPKFSVSIGVRIGRPEKAAARTMNPPIHSLFPIGNSGGPTRDILKASHTEPFITDITLRGCVSCGETSLGLICRQCNSVTGVQRWCRWCKIFLDEMECPNCHKDTTAHQDRAFPLKSELTSSQARVQYRAHEPFKGVVSLIGHDRTPEPLEKGLLRQAFGLTTFKDGTVRFDATNVTLTHFKPSWLNTSLESLKKLGYTHDIHNKPLVDKAQMVELFIQDIILPIECGSYFVQAASYVDELLYRFYGKERFYNVKHVDDLVGHLVAGLAPHTSVGVVGRIVGFTNTQVCFATPNWHAAKRRDSDGDADSAILLLDAMLNFSKKFLSDKIGGLMDAPLLIQPTVLPHESPPQAHNLEVCSAYPLQFFEDTLMKKRAADVTSVALSSARLDTIQQFSDYMFTHYTSTLVTSRSQSAYTTLGSMLDKLDMQIKNANLIDAVDTPETVNNVITTHLVPDIMGNLRSYARQKFRCTACGAQFRRPPLSGRCACGKVPISTIARASVEKYLQITQRLVSRYDVGEYQKDRVRALSEEIELVFGKGSGEQMLLTDYV
ncbi:MAG: DNA polymerase II large subunit [Cenarchaeum sp. SB0678_bin_8]|nr:DNA polymerase II large subunit [Cenarchaeum sp. SB0666_bin_15]MYB47427.1 DNA polymerase II large subunit [Cenarchaeum sp. SB0662_bin_33]MYD59115.1 DNA polymerase II large subunit [Cenarchaeum sp. SB0678_bin_8]MYJ28026.1 DNA polymerase II large subunit [Cenarchaeum sp. SB0672_bin_9]